MEADEYSIRIQEANRRAVAVGVGLGRVQCRRCADVAVVESVVQDQKVVVPDARSKREEKGLIPPSNEEA